MLHQREIHEKQIQSNLNRDQQSAMDKQVEILEKFLALQGKAEEKLKEFSDRADQVINTSKCPQTF